MKRYLSKRFSLKAMSVLCAVPLIFFSSASYAAGVSQTTNPISVPEPATVFILGLGCLLIVRKNRR
jgi:hypothetical protein